MNSASYLIPSSHLFGPESVLFLINAMSPECIAPIIETVQMTSIYEYLYLMLKMLRCRDCDSLNLHIKYEITGIVQSLPVTVELLEKFSCLKWIIFIIQIWTCLCFSNQFLFSSWICLSSFKLSMDLYCKRYWV